MAGGRLVRASWRIAALGALMLLSCGTTGELRGYDLRRDGEELNPVAAPAAAVSELEARLTTIHPLAPHQHLLTLDIPPELGERLRALGCVK